VKPVAKRIKDEEEDEDDIPPIFWHLLFLTPEH